MKLKEAEAVRSTRSAQEAVRNAASPISEGSVASAKEAEEAEEGQRDGTTVPQELEELRNSLEQKLDRSRKWSQESGMSGSTAAPDDTEIRPSMSNSPVSTMTSFEANRSRACSNGSISSETVEFDMKIQEGPAHQPWPWNYCDSGYGGRRDMTLCHHPCRDPQHVQLARHLTCHDVAKAPRYFVVYRFIFHDFLLVEYDWSEFDLRLAQLLQCRS